jgi:hypothetical protein
MMSVYIEQGYKNRQDYLENLADDYGVPFKVVAMLAIVLGPSEDFEALVCEVEDYSYYFYSVIKRFDCTERTNGFTM